MSDKGIINVFRFFYLIELDKIFADFMMQGLQTDSDLYISFGAVGKWTGQDGPELGIADSCWSSLMRPGVRHCITFTPGCVKATCDGPF